MKRVFLILAFAVVVALLFSLTGMHVRQDLGWIDSISGSQKRQTVWRIGAVSSPVVSESPLAARYRTLGLKWEPDWKNVQGTYVDVFGHRVGSGHGFAPEIYSFAVLPNLEESFLAASSDDDVREFFHVMSSGTEQEKKAAVEAASNKALGEYAATRPGG